MRAFFSLTDGLGGAEQIIFNLARYYKQQNSNVIIFIFGKRTNTAWTDEFSHVHYAGGSFQNLIRFVWNNTFKFVFSSHLMMNSFLGFFRTVGLLKTDELICRESTLVFGRYSGTKLRRYKIAYWLGYRNIDLLITQTSAMEEGLKKQVPYLTERMKIKTIPNPFNFPAAESVNSIVDVAEHSLVSAGRLIPEKGFDILIRTFAKILKSRPEMNLIILGEGGERSRLEALISELKLENKVLLKGHVKNVYPYFKSAAICVVSSRREGFPNVLLQMMSQNTRVVSTLCAGDIENIEGLFLAKTDDVESLYTAVDTCLKTDNSTNETLFSTDLKARSLESFVKKMTT